MRKAIRLRAFPYVFQVISLLVFLCLVANGFLTGGPESYAAGLSNIVRKTNLATLLVWGVWWPGLVLATILVGRLWCMACPMELVTNVTRRISSALGLRGLALPKWLRMGFGILLAYIILQFAVAGFQTHRTPLYTSYVLMGLLLLAALAGILFREPRAFCKGLCPAALLLDLYSRLSPVTLVNRSDDTCSGCETKDCVKEENRRRLDARSCPSYLRPYDLDVDDPCVLCFQCAKVCPHDNIAFGAARSGVTRRAVKALGIAPAIFVFLASGFVTHELFAETKALDEIFHAVPTFLSNAFHAPGLFKWLEAVWFLFILPAAVCGILWLTTLLLRSGRGVGNCMRQAALFLIPVIAAGHAIKALIKINSWGAFLPGALREPIGLERAKAIAAKTISAPGTLIPETILSAVVALILAVALIFAARAIRKHLDEAIRMPAYVGVSLLATLYGVVIGYLFIQ
ncbi:MAG: 4Fe-4S binding protein [Planctomycetota bacterium]